jgi:ubiquinone/menaquinone biosynthesis C-methylase UbiE
MTNVNNHPKGLSAMTKPIEELVREKYASAATSTLSGDHAGVKSIANAFGYSDEELAAIPAEANLGLSCGNPTATANLKPGEVVVDLGCGAGIDVLLAARKVGPSGRSIGIDMTPEMLARARENAAKLQLTNVDFYEAGIDHIPLPDQSVDCIISNCVINLADNKPAVFREMYRILKPGGRLAISDIALKKPLPDSLRHDLMAYVGCIAGAILIDDYYKGLTNAGFASPQIIDLGKDLNAYAAVDGQSACCPPTMEPDKPAGLNLIQESCCSSTPTNDVHEGLSMLLAKCNINDFAASVQLYAVKP